MTHKEAGRITDYHEGLLASLAAREVQAHPATCNKRHIYSRHSQQPSPALGKAPEPSSFSPKGKVENLTAYREQPGGRLRSMLTRPREVGAVAARILLLVAIIWAVKIWTLGIAPTQRYEEYNVDFTKQPALQHESLPSTVPPAVIPRGRLDLVVHLGLGNQPGVYDVVVTQDGTTYSAASGTTKLENRKPILRVKLDLTQAPAGHSLLGIRPAGWEWKYYKVTLKSAHWVGH
jgi:hypothetical protein